MSAERVQAEINRSLKKVVKEFGRFERRYGDILEPIGLDPERGLGAQLERLRRSRDDIEMWIADDDMKRETGLLDNQELVETEVDEFGAREKGARTQALLNEGPTTTFVLYPKARETTEVLNNGSLPVNKVRGPQEDETYSTHSNTDDELDPDEEKFYLAREELDPQDSEEPSEADIQSRPPLHWGSEADSMANKRIGSSIPRITGHTPAITNPPLRSQGPGPHRQPSGLSRGTRSIWELLAQNSGQVEGESERRGITAYDSNPSFAARPARSSSNLPAWKRLITHSLPPHEINSLVNEVFMSEYEVKTVCALRGDEAQTFISVVHEALDFQDLQPRLREKCLAALCRICVRQGLLPRALRVPICYDRLDPPLYRGGFADVWRGEHRGCHVAVKVLRVYSTSNIVRVTSRFCKEVVTWSSLCHPNVLPLLGAIMDKGQCAMVSEWMKNGNINEFASRHREVNRFELLKDVTNGLIYLHSREMIHGDLKGANILISQDGRARLADFGLLTIVSDPTYFTTSNSTLTGGTIRWMGPELLDPEKFGLDNSRPTKESDCYALGMVVYEVLSCQPPFASSKDHVVVRKVIEGERPERPKGAIEAWFAEDLWEMLCQCWETRAQSRPSIEAVLKCLDRVSGTWRPLPLEVERVVEEDESIWDLSVLRPGVD